jgi:hypothetical protein
VGSVEVRLDVGALCRVGVGDSDVGLVRDKNSRVFRLVSLIKNPT